MTPVSDRVGPTNGVAILTALGRRLLRIVTPSLRELIGRSNSLRQPVQGQLLIVLLQVGRPMSSRS
jgi:hypothetical protein